MPEIQTQTPVEYEPVCTFCYTRCESGGNSCEPIIFLPEGESDGNERCCDDCNINILMDIRIKVAQRTLEQCYECDAITNYWEPFVYSNEEEVKYLCQNCCE